MSLLGPSIVKSIGEKDGMANKLYSILCVPSFGCEKSLSATRHTIIEIFDVLGLDIIPFLLKSRPQLIFIAGLTGPRTHILIKVVPDRLNDTHVGASGWPFEHLDTIGLEPIGCHFRSVLRSLSCWKIMSFFLILRSFRVPRRDILRILVY